MTTIDRMNYKRYWIDKQGKKHLISKMSDEHLLNAIRMLEKNATETAGNCPFPAFQGEMAQYYAENDYLAMQEDPLEFFLSGTVYDYLLNEAIKRGIL